MSMLFNSVHINPLPLRIPEEILFSPKENNEKIISIKFYPGKNLII